MSNPTPRSWYLRTAVDAVYICGISLAVGFIGMFTLLGVGSMLEGVAEAHKRAEKLEERVAQVEKRLDSTHTTAWLAPAFSMGERR